MQFESVRALAQPERLAVIYECARYTYYDVDAGEADELRRQVGSL